MGCVWDVLAAQWGHAAFQAANVALLVYAISRFIGWRQFGCDFRPKGLLLEYDKAGASAVNAASERAAA